MKFIKKNKFTIMAIIIFIMLVIVGIKVKELLVPDDGKASYGDRLIEKSEHPLDDSLFTNIEENLASNTAILNFSHQVHGKIINLIITLSDDVSVTSAKEFANGLLNYFEDELDYYTLQVYLKKENEELNNFPIIGYKGTESSQLVFTKDRDITKSEETNEE